MVFASDEFRSRVTARPCLVFQNFSLFFRPWTRLAQAERRVSTNRQIVRNLNNVNDQYSIRTITKKHIIIG